MKIDNSFKSVTPTVAPRVQPKTAQENASTVAEAVSLSPLAGTLQASEKAPVNSARVQEIKEAIAQGKFKINPEAIAEKLLDTARELVTSQRRA